MVYDVPITQEQAIHIANVVKGKYGAPAWPASPKLYLIPGVYEAVEEAQLLNYATGELKRRLVMLNEKQGRLKDLTGLVLDLHAVLLARLNNGHGK